MSQRRRKLPAFLSGDRTKTDVFNCNALSLHYLRTVDEVEWGAQCILQRAQEESLIPFVLGFDIEWRVNFRTGMAQPKVALLQLADDTSCYLFHIFHSGLTTSLVKILAAEHILKVGAGVLGDCEKLKVGGLALIVDRKSRYGREKRMHPH